MNEEEEHQPFITEKFCTCGKMSWDSHYGKYEAEKHESGVKMVSCNTDGGTYIDGVKQ